MGDKLHFSMIWDTEKEMLHVSYGMQEMSFSKAFLEDQPAWQFVKYLDKLSEAAHQPYKPYKPSKSEVLAQLCLPHIQQLWHLHTGGSVTKIYYSPDTETFNLVMSQSFVLQLPKIIFEDEKYAHLDMILGWLSNNWKNLKHIAGYDFSVDKDVYYELGFVWSEPAKPLDKLDKIALFSELYGMDMSKYLVDYSASVPSPSKPKPIKELHVYDLGDGMLVPCELANEIVSWIGHGKHSSWWMSQEMIEDDLYGTTTKTAVKAIADKVNKDILQNAMSLFPGKAWLVDDVADTMHYLVDPSQYFTLDVGLDKFDFISTKHHEGSFYGKSIAEMLAEPQPVAIPKKPKQITAESLAHFYKLLGGKKNPF